MFFSFSFAHSICQEENWNIREIIIKDSTVYSSATKWDCFEQFKSYYLAVFDGPMN